MRPITRVGFAPDYRLWVPYQAMLAEALRAIDVDVSFVEGYRRGLPLFRGIRKMPMDLLHLHFPVHYMIKKDRLDYVRKIRFLLDLTLSTVRLPLVYTVHDLYPLEHRTDYLVKACTRYIFRRASAVIVHSDISKNQVISGFGVNVNRCTVIPHGDMSGAYGTPITREAARVQLDLNAAERFCLAFGTLAPNKGTDELVEYWRKSSPPATLLIVGRGQDPNYVNSLAERSKGVPNVRLVIGFQSDEKVRLWLCASDCVVLNYRKVFTSGVASLARSFGLPILLPHRLDTIYLDEPHPLVFRFDDLESDFGIRLQEALQKRRDESLAAEWRRKTSWPAIAEETKRVYESVSP
jgi:glycosyltransferase involved in cell wall biosynthesis